MRECIIKEKREFLDSAGRKLALFQDKPGVFYCTWIEIRFPEIAGNSNPRCYTLLLDKPTAANFR